MSGLEMVNSSAVMGDFNEDEGVLSSEDNSEGSVPTTATSVQDGIAKQIYETILKLSPSLALPKMSDARSQALWISLATELAPLFMQK